VQPAGLAAAAALVAPDLPGGVDIDRVEPGRDGVGALLVITGPRLLTEELGNAVGDHRAMWGMPAGFNAGSNGEG
jgi:hypothetical protein